MSVVLSCTVKDKVCSFCEVLLTEEWSSVKPNLCLIVTDVNRAMNQSELEANTSIFIGQENGASYANQLQKTVNQSKHEVTLSSKPLHLVIISTTLLFQIPS